LLLAAFGQLLRAWKNENGQCISLAVFLSSARQAESRQQQAGSLECVVK
jgi:hypothetical protein